MSKRLPTNFFVRLTAMLLVLFYGVNTQTFAQAKKDSVRIQVVDAYYQEPILFGNVFCYQNGIMATKETDLDGYAWIPSVFDSIDISYTGYTTERVYKIPENRIVLLAENELLSCPVILGPTITDTPLNPSISKSKTISIEKDANNLTHTPLHLLNQVPGIEMQSGALNTNRISIRGIGNRSRFSTSKLKAYLDNIPLTNGVGETSIEDIDLSMIKTMEITKGPAHTAHGASLGGSVLLNSQNISNYQSRKLELSTTIGDYGLRRYVANTTYVNDKRNFSLQANYNNTKDAGHRANNNYARQGFGLLSKYEIGKHQLSILYNHVDLNAQIPSSLSQSDFDENPERAAFVWQAVNGYEDAQKNLVGANLRYQISSDWSWITSLGYNTRSGYEVRPFNVLEEQSNGKSFRTLLRRDELHDANIQIGFEYYSEDYDWNIYETLDGGAQGLLIGANSEDRRYINIFAEAKHYLDDNQKWLLSGGINANNTQYDYRDLYLSDGDATGDYGFDWVISPRAAVTRNLLGGQSITGSVSHGFAAPTLEETLTPDGTINPDIQPERGWNIELKLAKENHQIFNYELSVYGIMVSDLLVSRRTDFDQFIGINAGKTRHLGLELSVDYDLIEHHDHLLNIQMNYAYSHYRFLDFTDDEQDYSGNALTGTPPHVFNNVLRYSYRQFEINVQYRYMDQVPLRDDNSIYSESFHLAHLRAKYSHDFGQGIEIVATTGINNLLDKKYASQYLINAASFGGSAPRYFYPGRGRNAYFGLKLSYLIP